MQKISFIGIKLKHILTESLDEKMESLKEEMGQGHQQFFKKVCNT
jgi:hypothetical protein